MNTGLFSLPFRFAATGILACIGGATTALSASPFLSIGNAVDVFFDGSATYRYTTNVFNAPDNENDHIFILSPGIEAVFGRNSLITTSLEARYDIIRYADFSVADAENLNLILTSRYNGPRLSATGTFSFEQITQNTSALVGGLVLNDLIDRNVLTFGVSGSYRVSEKISTTFGGSYERETFQNFEAAFNDRQTFTVPLRAFYQLTPKIDVGGGYRFRFTDVDANAAGGGAAIDRTDHFFSISTRGEFFPKLSGELDLGIGLRTFDDDTDSEVNFSVDGGLDYAYSSKLAFGLDLGRDFETGGAGSSIQRTEVALNANYAYSSRISAGTRLEYQRDSFEQLVAPRVDNIYTGSVFASYAFNRYFSFSASYAYQDVNSDAFNVSYNAHNISISAGVRY
ncbi:MAG: outer membrane beta-barrel protein [Opitutales bacterium]